MPRYPIQQARIIALAEAMIAGYTEHAAQFPNSDAALLQTLRDAYNTAAAARTEAMAAAQLATESKQQALAALQAEMKRQLKQSQVDTSDDPVKLEYIGWGPRREAEPAEPPGQPMSLKSINEGAGTLEIGWKRPARGSGGPVRTYIIERRTFAANDELRTPDSAEGGWSHAAISLETRALLKRQPRGVQLEYRVKAINKAGESKPSNTIAVVL